MTDPKPNPTPDQDFALLKNMDQRIEDIARNMHAPRHMADATAYVHDTLKTAWVSARGLFGSHATPEHALAIFDRINDRRRQLLDEEEEQRKLTDEG
jgi:hypothetical protein